MAYINCKKCGCQMSDKSEACPVCGTPVDINPDSKPTEEYVNESQGPEQPLQESTLQPITEKERGKKKALITGIVTAVVLVGAIILASNMISKKQGNGQGKKDNDKTTNATIQDSHSIEEMTDPADNRPRVYTNAFDGFVNIREKPEAKASILGILRNGPEGAVLLDTIGEWTKIDCNDIVGFVVSKFVQDTPTIAYTGTATIDQIAGVYEYCYGFCQYLFLYYDGSYSVGGEDIGMGRGRYVLQNNEVKLIPIYENDGYSDVIEHILPIDVSHNKLGKFNKKPFLTDSDISRAKVQYGEDWFEVMYYGEYVFAGTLKDFKKRSALE